MLNTPFLQVRYYFGEESSHDLGFGVAYGNLSMTRYEVGDNFDLVDGRSDLYVGEEVLIEIPELLRENPTTIFEYWCHNTGELGLRIIGRNVESLERCASTLKLPFLEKIVIPLILEDRENPILNSFQSQLAYLS